ncbi:MAG: 4'-phosphopantetheinyl transferase family protein, partial [Gammaproteobacteria bacterium]
MAAPVSDLVLGPGQIDVWMASTAAGTDSWCEAGLATVLSDDERQRHGRYMFAKDRRRFLVTRLLVRYVLSRYVAVAPADWRFAASAYGKPMIANAHPVAADLAFNVSHSDQVVLLGITRDAALGIDVEDRQRRIPLNIADSYFSAGEMHQLRALPASLQGERFLDFWTLKESYIKARGEGLSLPLDQFCFDLSEAARIGISFDARLDDAPARWKFWQWQPTEDSTAALCVQQQPGRAGQQSITMRRTVPFVSE